MAWQAGSSASVGAHAPPAGAAALQVLQRLPHLAALDLSGLAQVGDSSAAVLAALPRLEALDASGTSCGDKTLEVR
jgi:hypothetical protein